MSSGRYLTGLLLVAAACAGPAAQPAAARPGRSEVIIEGAAASPRGDLKAAHAAPEGFGAEMGYDIGFRYRQVWAGGWALSPSFHYVKFGKFSGYDADLEDDFEIGTSVFRYGVDLQYAFGSGDRGTAPFLLGGVSLVRNKMREEYESDGSFFEDGANGLALNAGLGLRRGDFEFSFEYHMNRFDTLRFWDGVSEYDWDYMTLRIGFALPRYDR